MAIEPTVMIVEDDLEMRESLGWMLRTEGIQVAEFGSPSELLRQYDPALPGCLLLDLHLPEMSGLELQQQLVHRGGRHPFIVITGHGDVPNAVQAMKVGAVDFLQKPFDRQQLLQRVWDALQRDDDDRRQRAAELNLQSRIDSLTPRERQVMNLVVDGMLTKQIATKLGISSKTVEVHRSHVTKKMHVESVAQLVKAVTTYANRNGKPDVSKAS